MTAGNDPLLTSDECTFLEVVKDDQGLNKASNPYWWASWDFWLTDQSGNLIGDTPLDGQTCNVNVRYHLKYDVLQETQCPLLPGTDYIKGEVFLCTPGLAMTPNTAAAIPFPNPDMDPTQFVIDTTNNIKKSKVQVLQAPFTFHRTGPTDDGHRCLIGRCFQHGQILFASPTDFYTPDDQHYGQHNLHISQIQSHRREGASTNFAILTTNTDKNVAQPATIRAVADTNPAQQIKDLALPRLQRLNVFKRFITTPSSRGFSLSLPDFPNATTRNNSVPYKGLFGFLLLLILLLLSLIGIKLPIKQPVYEADIVLNPGQVTNFSFIAVESPTVPVGDARIYHITHLDSQQRVQGGLTLITVVSN